jgi:hypothetical protein
MALMNLDCDNPVPGRAIRPTRLALMAAAMTTLVSACGGASEGLTEAPAADQVRASFTVIGGPPTPIPIQSPQIARGPENATIAAGAGVRFSVLATGIQPLTYRWHKNGVAIAGEAHLVLAVEDIDEALLTDPVEGEARGLSLERLADRIVDVMLTRARKHNKHYGVVVLAEGLSELLPPSQLVDVPRDAHGHISLGNIDLGKLVARTVAARFQERTGEKKKINGLQLGYESRCAVPHAFDVMLGSQLGIGAFRALVEEGLDGHMVSVSGQLDLHYVPFHRLVDAETLKTEVRLIRPHSDYHRLARFLESRADRVADWAPGPRRER